MQESTPFPNIVRQDYTQPSQSTREVITDKNLVITDEVWNTLRDLNNRSDIITLKSLSLTFTNTSNPQALTDKLDLNKLQNITKIELTGSFTDALASVNIMFVSQLLSLLKNVTTIKIDALNISPSNIDLMLGELTKLVKLKKLRLNNIPCTAGLSKLVSYNSSLQVLTLKNITIAEDQVASFATAISNSNISNLYYLLSPNVSDITSISLLKSLCISKLKSIKLHVSLKHAETVFKFINQHQGIEFLALNFVEINKENLIEAYKIKQLANLPQLKTCGFTNLRTYTGDIDEINAYAGYGRLISKLLSAWEAPLKSLILIRQILNDDFLPVLCRQLDAGLEKLALPSSMLAVLSPEERLHIHSNKQAIPMDYLKQLSEKSLPSSALKTLNIAEFKLGAFVVTKGTHGCRFIENRTQKLNFMTGVAHSSIETIHISDFDEVDNKEELITLAKSKSIINFMDGESQPVKYFNKCAFNNYLTHHKKQMILAELKNPSFELVLKDIPTAIEKYRELKLAIKQLDFLGDFSISELWEQFFRNFILYYAKNYTDINPNYLHCAIYFSNESNDIKHYFSPEIAYELAHMLSRAGKSEIFNDNQTRSKYALLMLQNINYHCYNDKKIQELIRMCIRNYHDNLEKADSNKSYRWDSTKCITGKKIIIDLAAFARACHKVFEEYGAYESSNPNKIKGVREVLSNILNKKNCKQSLEKIQTFWQGNDRKIILDRLLKLFNCDSLSEIGILEDIIINIKAYPLKSKEHEKAALLIADVEADLDIITLEKDMQYFIELVSASLTVANDLQLTHNHIIQLNSVLENLSKNTESLDSESIEDELKSHINAIKKCEQKLVQLAEKTKKASTNTPLNSAKSEEDHRQTTQYLASAQQTLLTLSVSSDNKNSPKEENNASVENKSADSNAEDKEYIPSLKFI